MVVSWVAKKAVLLVGWSAGTTAAPRVDLMAVRKAAMSVAMKVVMKVGK